MLCSLPVHLRSTIHINDRTRDYISLPTLNNGKRLYSDPQLRQIIQLCPDCKVGGGTRPPHAGFFEYEYGYIPPLAILAILNFGSCRTNQMTAYCSTPVPRVRWWRIAGVGQLQSFIPTQKWCSITASRW